MKTSIQKPGQRGAVSFLLVLTVGTVALILTLYTYRQAIASHETAADVELRNDYSEKEDAILRAIVALTPNRAILVMKKGANESSAKREPLRWQNIFEEAVELANAGTSVSSDLQTTLGLTNLIVANSGDASLIDPDLIFNEVQSDTEDAYHTEYMSAGINRSLGSGYPPPLQTGNTVIIEKDAQYPIISTQKTYGSLASGSVGLSVTEYPDFNLLEYPQISFGYAQPGENFVAKRNWWAFSLDLAGNNHSLTNASVMQRNYVISIYEIPSQLAISASAFMSLGEFGTGDTWDNVTIAGGVFAGKAIVEGEMALPALASRRGMTLSSDAVIGGESFSSSPFAPGVREVYQLTEGNFFPVSMSSESGRVAFVPINRQEEFFDRFANTSETNTISPTTWNNYSSGSLQCAMRLDITDCVSSINSTPTELRFSYYKGGVRETIEMDLNSSGYSGLEAGYLYACDEDATYDFGDAVVDVAYGEDGGGGGTYAYQYGVTGSVTFDNPRFGDPLVGVRKSGYYKPSYPFEIKSLDSGRICVAVYPQRFEKFLEALNADDTSINHSLVVNVDYTGATGSINLDEPSIPSTDLDYGVILDECADFTTFPKGFSLVTNLRTYIGDDFNIVETSPPSGYSPSGAYYPPCSIFSPEKRYGVDVDPYAVDVSGQVGSLASDTGSSPIRPLDSTSASGMSYASDRITVNLSPMAHPAELPPITMMNWLITLTEVRDEFVDY